MIRRRREFSAQTKREAFARSGGRCEGCTAPLSMANINYDFDHEYPDALGGEPTLSNCRVLCKTCHSSKTRVDRKVIAKSNHVRDLARGIKQNWYRPLIGTKRSGIKLSFRGPVDRRTGLPWRS